MIIFEYCCSSFEGERFSRTGDEDTTGFGVVESRAQRRCRGCAGGYREFRGYPLTETAISLLSSHYDEIAASAVESLLWKTPYRLRSGGVRMSHLLCSISGNRGRKKRSELMDSVEKVEWRR